MSLIQRGGNAFLTLWLWGLTGSAWHAPLSCAVLTLLLIYCCSMRILPAGALAAIFHFFSWAVYSLLVVLGFIVVMGCCGITLQGNAEPASWCDAVRMSLLFGMVHALLQIIFCALISVWYRLPLWKIAYALVASNIIAAGVCALVAR